MPRKSPGALRAVPSRPAADHVSSLRITVCPGPPACDGWHTVLHVDGTDLIAATDPELRGLDPDQLLRPGGPLYPADHASRTGIAYLPGSCCVPECHGLTFRLLLRGDHVTWSDLSYQDLDGQLIERVRFDLGDYLRTLAAAHADRSWEPPQRRLRRLIQQRLDAERPLLRFGVACWHVALDTDSRQISATLCFPGPRHEGGGQHTFLLAPPAALPEHQQVDAAIRDLTRTDPRGRLPHRP